MKRVRSIAIAGAGLSGLAVAVALRERGFAGSIDIVDAKPHFSDDRTWCWWQCEDDTFAEIASSSWTQCRVSYGGQSATMKTTAHPYLHISSADYYDACLARLSNGDTTMSLGERVVAIDDRADAAYLRTTQRELRADLIVDARGSRRTATLHQHFFGIRVVADEPVFDCNTVTLMDFEPARHGLRFTYVLPFSPYEALVEDTVVDAAAPDDSERRRGIERYLSERYGLHAWREKRTEAGAIPLDARRVSTFASPRVVRAGIAAGATRASSGYTFVRTQRHARAVADYVVDGRKLATASSPVYALLDGLALKTLRGDAVDVPQIVTALFRDASGNSLARFLSDVAAPRDFLEIFAAIILAFPGAAARRGRERRQ